VRALIRNEKGEVLLVQRAKKPAQGKWILPGGKVEFHEKAKDAVAREIKEELDCKFEPHFLLFDEDFGSVPDKHCLVFYYTGKMTGKMKTKPDEILAARYFSLDEIKKSPDIGFNHKEKLMEIVRQ